MQENKIMKILLIDVDSKIPNLALMKLSSYYKSQKDSVKLYYLKDLNNINSKNYDIIYASIIFTKNKKEEELILNNFPNAIIGGSGTENYNITLPEKMEHIMPDYTLYDYNLRGKRFKYFEDISMGFTSRGCIRKCKFCIVNKKEGLIQDWADIYEFWNKKHSTIMLLDNNFFANRNWKTHADNIIKENLFVLDNGFDIRILTEEMAWYLSKIKFTNKSHTAKGIHFAFDNMQDETAVVNGIKLLSKYMKPIYSIFYILSGYNTTLKEDQYRFDVIRKLGCRPYIMPHENATQEQKIFANYVNQFLYTKFKFEEFDRYKKYLKEGK